MADVVWLEFEVRKLDMIGNDFGLGFYRGFSILKTKERIDRLEIYEMQSFEIPVLLAVGEWRGDRWLLSSKHDSNTLHTVVNRVFETCKTPYHWLGSSSV